MGTRQETRAIVGKIWSESHTSHSDKNGEWKVGLKGNAPEVRRKITIGKSDGKIIKFDNKERYIF